MINVSNEIIHRIKTDLISAYKSNGNKNCIGSVEKVVEELFELRNKMIEDESSKFKQLILDNWNNRINETK